MQAATLPEFVELPTADEPIVTPWTASRDFDPGKHWGIDPVIALAQDWLFRSMVLALLPAQGLELLRRAIADGCRVIVAPQYVVVVTRDRRLVPLPELGQYLQFLPWQEPGEAVH